MIPEGTKVSVSATAAGTSRRALLSDDENAWTAPSCPAHISLSFPDPIAPTKLALTFQGGFAATAVALSSGGKDLGKVFPEDVNRRQVFDLPDTGAISSLRLDLEGTSDNQGRITLYHIELLP